MWPQLAINSKWYQTHRRHLAQLFSTAQFSSPGEKRPTVRVLGKIFCIGRVLILILALILILILCESFWSPGELLSSRNILVFDPCGGDYGCNPLWHEVELLHLTFTLLLRFLSHTKVFILIPLNNGGIWTKGGRDDGAKGLPWGCSHWLQNYWKVLH